MPGHHPNQTINFPLFVFFAFGFHTQETAFFNPVFLTSFTFSSLVAKSIVSIWCSDSLRDVVILFTNGGRCGVGSDDWSEAVGWDVSKSWVWDCGWVSGTLVVLDWDIWNGGSSDMWVRLRSWEISGHVRSINAPRKLKIHGESTFSSPLIVSV